MRKASDFLSKPLISLNEGKNEGVIKNISFDLKLRAAEWLVLYDENDCDCDEKAVRVSEAYCLGENAVMIKSSKEVIPAVSAPIIDNNPINCRVFTALGKLAGTVSDVILTDENLTSGLVYDNGKILPLSEIISGSRGIVVKSEGDIKTKEPVPVKKVPAPKPEDTKRKVKALPSPKPKIKKNEPVKPSVKKNKEEAAQITVKTEEFKPVAFNVENIIIKEPVKAKKLPEPPKDDYYKVYDDLSVNFSELYQPEVFIDGLGVAMPIKKDEVPDGPKERFVRAFQLQHAPEPVVREPVIPLIFDNGESIEIWPLELEHIPERIIASYSFLLGRRVAKNIYNAAQQLVIRADATVSPQIVETARKYGRLVDLTKLSL